MFNKHLEKANQCKTKLTVANCHPHLACPMTVNVQNGCMHCVEIAEVTVSDHNPGAIGDALHNLDKHIEIRNLLVVDRLHSVSI